MRLICFLFLLGYSLNGYAQILAQERSVDWNLAGLRGGSADGFIEIDMQSRGAIGDGVTANDGILDDVLSSISGTGTILKFPTGDFLFNNTIALTSNIVIQGAGADQTKFTMDLSGTGHSFIVQGSVNQTNTTSLSEAVTKDSDFIVVTDPSSFSVGDWIQIIQEDDDLVSSTWAINSVGQIVKIASIENNRILLESPLRMDYSLDRLPSIMEIVPTENVGIACLKILRLDNTAPEQSSNINFNFAVNSWVLGVESENCTFSHIQANRSANLYVAQSYFHHAFEYGGGGRAYGVALQGTSNECLVENNIFEHLRHSILLQSGANGNVFSYNYSVDPYREDDPHDATGDMVLHGNYPYANLFEQNICQNMVIDNSHGANGPYNTFFRNRGESFGLYFSEINSPFQNLIGNEIPNTNDPYAQYNYIIKGANHFIYGNNNKGVIHPAGTSVLSESSLVYDVKPDFIPVDQWAGIGTPNELEGVLIPAYDRYEQQEIFNMDCGLISSLEDNKAWSQNVVSLAPNPNRGVFNIVFNQDLSPKVNLYITEPLGKQVVYQKEISSGAKSILIDTPLSSGTYLLHLQYENQAVVKRLVIIE